MRQENWLINHHSKRSFSGFYIFP